MDDLGFAYSWTPPASPQYNGIEEVFSIAKREIKKERKVPQNYIEIKVNIKAIINESFNGLKI